MNHTLREHLEAIAIAVLILAAMTLGVFIVVWMVDAL